MLWEKTHYKRLELSLPKIFAEIAGTGASVPERVLTNKELSEMVDTSDEWIQSRTGIQERRIADNGQLPSDLAMEASKIALKNSGISPEDLDLIIVGTVTPDMIFPSTGCFLQQKLGAKNAAAFDISAACTGFIYGLSIADGMISSGKYENILVVGVEILSRIINWEDRDTCILFGDGAGAVVVRKAAGDRRIINTYIKSDGNLSHLLNVEGGGSLYPSQKFNEHPEKFYIRMEGREVFRHAVSCMGDAATRLIEENGFTVDEIKLVIPHQANIRIIDAIAKRLSVPKERVYINVNRFGNTSSASIPIALHEAYENGQIKENDIVLLVAFGGGFTWGSALIEF